MKHSLVKKRSIIINKLKTSISLEDNFYDSLKEIAKILNMNVNRLIEIVDSKRNAYNLSSALRLYVLNYYKQRVTITREFT